MKTCCICKQTKSIDSFYKNKSHSGGITSECKVCRNKINRKFQNENKEKIKQNKINKLKKLKDSVKNFDLITFKTCKVCGESKNLTMFYTNLNHKFGVSNECKSCKSDYSKKQRIDNPELGKERHKVYYIKNRLEIRKRVKDTIGDLNRRYSMLKNGAKVRGKELLMSKEEYISVVANSSCYYCGEKLDKTWGHSLDRINNEIGYKLDNVIPCCGICNKARGNRYTVEEFKVMIDALLKYRKGAEIIPFKKQIAEVM